MIIYEYDYTADKVINLIGNEANIKRPSSYKRQSLEMSDNPQKTSNPVAIGTFLVFLQRIRWHISPLPMLRIQHKQLINNKLYNIDFGLIYNEAPL